MKRVLFIASSVLLCLAKQEGSRCKTHLDCESGMMCHLKEKKCARMCFKDSDCALEGKCEYSSCPLKAEEDKTGKRKRAQIRKGGAEEGSGKDDASAKANQSCKTGKDCGYGADCILSKCAQHCDSDKDCKAAGTKCRQFPQGLKYNKDHRNTMQQEGDGANKTEGETSGWNPNNRVAIRHTRSGKCIGKPSSDDYD